MCAGREFQVEGADTEKAREEKLLVIPAGLVRRFILEERMDLGVRNEFRQVERLRGMKCFNKFGSINCTEISYLLDCY